LTTKNPSAYAAETRRRPFPGAPRLAACGCAPCACAPGAAAVRAACLISRSYACAVVKEPFVVPDPSFGIQTRPVPPGLGSLPGARSGCCAPAGGKPQVRHHGPRL